MKTPAILKNPHLKRAFSVKNQKECKQLYEQWAESYDEHMVEGLNYKTPEKLAMLLARYLPDLNAEVLDLGCGTGLVGQALADLGYSHVDGIDFSEPMLDQAQQRGVYRKTFQGDLNKRTQVADGAYDAAMSAGIFTYGHLDASCLDEILRMIRVGGLLVTAIRVQIWESMHFAAKFDELLAEKKIQFLFQRALSNYEGLDEKDGLYLVVQKTAPAAIKEA